MPFQAARATSATSQERKGPCLLFPTLSPLSEVQHLQVKTSTESTDYLYLLYLLHLLYLLGWISV